MLKVPRYTLNAFKTSYIETPLHKYVGGEDKIMWPWIFVVITIGGFMGVMFL